MSSSIHHFCLIHKNCIFCCWAYFCFAEDKHGSLFAWPCQVCDTLSVNFYSYCALAHLNLLARSYFTSIYPMLCSSKSIFVLSGKMSSLKWTKTHHISEQPACIMWPTHYPKSLDHVIYVDTQTKPNFSNKSSLKTFLAFNTL